jgi:phosphoribosylformimino-5-aminoimidazole carboxamide ribotide isomerase
MQVWPAIDLRGGKCVRLRQGDYQQETIFAQEPAVVARQFAEQGARHLHIVDLEGAREGLPVNLPSVQEILAAVGDDMACELGGGIRDEQSVQEIFDFGLSRLVIGTSALTDPEWFRAACRQYPGRLVLGIDARDGRAATDGWLNTSDVTAIELAQQFAKEPLAAIIYTDIATDGMMRGPNIAAMAEMQAAVNVPIVASGGVTTLDDVARLATAGLAGCVIGRALYEGTLSLEDAIRVAAGEVVSKAH